MEATEYLKKVEERAKEMYALSDQGTWEQLAPWMQEAWIREADMELRPKLLGEDA